MNVYEEVVKHSKKLMFDEPFYGLMLIGMNKELSERIDTACVTRDNITSPCSYNHVIRGISHLKRLMSQTWFTDALDIDQFTTLNDAIVAGEEYIG